MSKLFSTDEPERVTEAFEQLVLSFDPLGPPPTKATRPFFRPVLRRNRRKPLHPEAIHELLRERSVMTMPKTGWHWPFGWIILLWRKDGSKPRVRDLSGRYTVKQARQIAIEEME